jgi:GTP-sensing pleiotropic transcriptional regulator CodY
MQLTHKMELHLLVPYNRETLMGFLDGLGTFAPQGGVGERLGQLLLDEEVPVVAFEVALASCPARTSRSG